MSKNRMQKRINEMQAVYRQWLALQESLKEAEATLIKSTELIGEMTDFFASGDYLEFYEAIEEGAQVDLRTEGEHSIMSEDALWNALNAHQQRCWQLIHFCIAQLDPNQVQHQDQE